MKCCYGTDAYGEEVVSNYPKPYDIDISALLGVLSRKIHIRPSYILCRVSGGNSDLKAIVTTKSYF